MTGHIHRDLERLCASIERAPAHKQSPAARPSEPTPTGLRNSAQGCEARATLGPRPIASPNPEGVASFRPFVPVVQVVENEYGWMGPDFCLITLRNGKLLEIGDEGVNVYPNRAAFGSDPEHSINFAP